jgi:Circularly permutated YpsA SLOG family
MFKLQKIVSGGQTGADRAALDFALERGIPHDGWCPKARKAEDGRIEARYRLQETPSSRYSQRTEWNVRDSDGTVIFSVAAQLTGGSKKTAAMARQYGKPLLHISRKLTASDAAEHVLHFLREHKIRTLNIAGPRASEEPEVYGFVKEVLGAALGVKDAQRPLHNRGDRPN